MLIRVPRAQGGAFIYHPSDLEEISWVKASCESVLIDPPFSTYSSIFEIIGENVARASVVVTVLIVPEDIPDDIVVIS